MSTIKVTPEQLLHVSKQIEQGRQQLESIRNDLTARIGFIESQWTGATQERFFYDFQQSRSVLNRALESIVKSSQDLRAIAERFQQVDQEQVSLGAVIGQIAAGSIMNQDTANREEQQRMVYNPLFGVVMPASEAEDGMPGQKELREYFNNGGSLEEMRAGPKQSESGGGDIYEEQIKAFEEGRHPITGVSIPAWQAGVSIASLQLGKIAMAFTGMYNKGYKVKKNGLKLFPKSKMENLNVRHSVYVNKETVLSSATTSKKGGETIVGHALQKHAGRNPDIWGKVRGGPDQINEVAKKHLQDILDSPGGFDKVTNDRGITFLEKKLPDGRGVRLNRDRSFKGFIDQ
ncbi:WXG100 family type VII secretion target [Paenibacillus barcinonensis]|uniref:WXG100 family type VII secretion target n=1 Tax=Paenibacillus barcinonensis TaxID=198119 RepID=A0A2V4VLR9_PAEBA|nr:WXG100 family type VII secretion target [Paenibacillus barcinonensis]PYE47222.1 WXG100 family type VII secretion target [Paenibacillus barcinonensis]QKS58618.1 WXG100 family type VII secretion target [Paenibacillus barcinonensis]